MKTIHKYPLLLTDSQRVEMRLGADIIHVGLDPHGIPSIWAVVDTADGLHWVNVSIVGTGSPFPTDIKRHIGSFNQGPFMWHVFIS